MNQLGLFGEPEPEPEPSLSLVAPPSLRERLMEALRRDVDTLSSPSLATMSPDIPDLIRERVADYRQRLAEEA